VHGRKAFHDGAIAAAIDRQMRALDGFLDRDDLASHRSQWVTPLQCEYRGYTVWQLPPNTQGLAVLQMLRILEGWDVAAMGRESPSYLHLLIEAKKLAFEDRARHYADPDFYDVPAAELLSPSYVQRQRDRIDPQTAACIVPSGDPRVLQAGDTVYLTTADDNGMMVSLIQSNFRGMGSGVVVPEFGFMLQNRGELFAMDAGHANAYAPGKRPFNTIIPGFVTRGDEFALSFGVMGADMQPQGQVQVLQNIIDFGLNVQEAGDAPRLRHDGSSTPTGETATGTGSVHLEAGFPTQAAEGLSALGHQVGPDNGYGFGGYQAILRDGRRGVYFGASESRKDGQAAGF
jgi:gamma-glutamyltranspeptidase / glutathione hydrolase